MADYPIRYEFDTIPSPTGLAMITKDEVVDALNDIIYNKMFGNE